MTFKWPAFVMRPLMRVLVADGFTVAVTDNRLTTNAIRSVIDQYITDGKIPPLLIEGAQD